MELATSKALIHLAAMAGVVFLAALFALTLADVLARLCRKIAEMDLSFSSSLEKRRRHW